MSGARLALDLEKELRILACVLLNPPPSKDADDFAEPAGFTAGFGVSNLRVCALREGSFVAFLAPQPSPCLQRGSPPVKTGAFDKYLPRAPLHTQTAIPNRIINLLAVRGRLNGGFLWANKSFCHRPSRNSCNAQIKW
jgi:hypothetical protein